MNETKKVRFEMYEKINGKSKKFHAEVEKPEVIKENGKEKQVKTEKPELEKPPEFNEKKNEKIKKMISKCLPSTFLDEFPHLLSYNGYIV